jgi:hypothetical protein
MKKKERQIKMDNWKDNKEVMMMGKRKKERIKKKLNRSKKM